MPNSQGDAAILVWDVDDVLNNLTLEVLKVLGVVELPNETTLAPDPESLIAQLGIDRATYIAALDDYRRSRFDELTPNPQVLEWFVRHGNEFTCMALTSTPLEFFSTSVRWVLKYFQPWIDSVGCTPSKRDSDRPDTKYLSKGQYLNRLRAPYVLIDDSKGNIESVTDSAGSAIHFPTQWNSRQSVQECLEQLSSLRQGE